MTTITFDTLAYARKLKQAGFTQEQAEAQAEAQSGMMSEILNSNLATKDDINRLEKQLRGDIDKLEKQLSGDIDKLDKQLSGDIDKLEKQLSGDIDKLDKRTQGDIIRLEKEILVLKWMTGFMLAGVVSLVMKAFFIS